MRYLDTSSVVKLFLDEAHSRAARAALSGETPNVSSVLLRIELLRVVKRSAPAAHDAAARELANIQLLPIDDAVVAQAAAVAPPELRSLDAIHLATALTIRDVLTEFVTYDRQLGLAAQAAGLPVRAPGLG